MTVCQWIGCKELVNSSHAAAELDVPPVIEGQETLL